MGGPRVLLMLLLLLDNFIYIILQGIRIFFQEICYSKQKMCKSNIQMFRIKREGSVSPQKSIMVTYL